MVMQSYKIVRVKKIIICYCQVNLEKIHFMNLFIDKISLNLVRQLHLKEFSALKCATIAEYFM